MGTYAQLYHHESAPTLVPALNGWRRMWGIASHAEWLERRRELAIGEDELPAGAREIAFAGSTESHPCDRDVTWVEALLADNQLPSLHACFGYSSAEPENGYAAPDWPAVRAALASLLDALHAPGLVTPVRPDSLHPRVHFTAPTVADCIGLVSAFLELAEWVLAQPKPDEYFMRWG